MSRCDGCKKRFWDECYVNDYDYVLVEQCVDSYVPEDDGCCAYFEPEED